MVEINWKTDNGVNKLEIKAGQRVIGKKVRQERVRLLPSESPLVVENMVDLLNENTRHDLSIKTPQQEEDLRHRGYRKGYDEGYSNAVEDLKDKELETDESIIDQEERELIEYMAMKDGLLDYGICHRCNESEPDSLHHIMPRKYGGGDTLNNLIPLCNNCHNEVEELTEDLQKDGGLPSINMIREYIETQFPNEQDTELRI